MRLRPLFAAVVLVVAAILIEPNVGGTVVFFYGLSAISLVLALVFLGNPRLSTLALLAPFFLVGLGRARLAQTPPLLVRDVGRYQVVTGQIVSPPEPIRISGQRFRLRVAQGELMVTAPPSPAGNLGDWVTVRGRLELPATATNPGEFDYRAYLKRHGIHVVLRSRSIERSTVAGGFDPASRLRSAIHSACFTHLPRDKAALLAGLLISDRSRLPVELNEAFLRTGTVHVLSTSGLHLSLLALLVSGFFRWVLPRQALLGVTLSLLLICIYALAAGGSGAVTRAAVMVGVVLFAPLLRREAEPLHSLALAALLILLVSPLALYDPGTQLSFATVAVLVLWYKTVERLVWPWEPNLRLRTRVTRGALLGLCVGVLAQLGSWLLVAFHFNLVSWIAPVANLLIAPLSELLLVVGLLAVALAGVPLLGATLWWVVGLGLEWLQALALGFAAIPFAASSVGSPSAVVVLVWYIALLSPARSLAIRLQKARLASL